MAGLRNIILWITMVLTSVLSMKIPLPNNQLPRNAEMLPDSTEYMNSIGSTNSLENDILYQDRDGQRQRIKTHDPVPPVKSDEDPNGFKLPESCKNSYCENVPEYPEEAVSKLISTLGEGVNLQIDKLYDPDFVERVAFDGNVDLCKSKETVVFPQAGIGYDNKPHLLLNGKEKKDKVQGFRVQSCLESDCQCDRVILGFENGYRGRCKQFFLYRTATAFRKIDSTTVVPYQTHIKLPGYCACVAETCIDDC